MAKAKTETKTYSEAEVQAMLADARKQGADDARKAKSAARAEKNAAIGKAGWSAFTLTEEHAGNNILGEGVFVVPGECVIEASVVMSRQNGATMPRYRLAVRPVWGVSGDTDTDAERLVASMSHKAKNAPAIVAALAKSYKAAAGGHTYRDKAAERKAEQAKQAKQAEQATA
jgi:hypothetical protein